MGWKLCSVMITNCWILLQHIQYITEEQIIQLIIYDLDYPLSNVSSNMKILRKDYMYSKLSVLLQSGNYYEIEFSSMFLSASDFV